jgi:hypothetical protein
MKIVTHDLKKFEQDNFFAISRQANFKVREKVLFKEPSFTVAGLSERRIRLENISLQIRQNLLLSEYKERKKAHDSQDRTS